MASPLPLLLDPSEGDYGVLYGHLARANPQWTAAPKGEALAVFMGPDAYVTPAWYQAKRIRAALNEQTLNQLDLQLLGNSTDAQRDAIGKQKKKLLEKLAEYKKENEDILKEAEALLAAARATTNARSEG